MVSKATTMTMRISFKARQFGNNDIHIHNRSIISSSSECVQ